MAAYVSPSPALMTSSLSHPRRPLRAITRPATQQPQAIPTPKTRDEKILFDQSVAEDSSDDEDLAPIKLSAEAQAILGEDNEQPEARKENVALQIHSARLTITTSARRRSRATPLEIRKSSSPPQQTNGSPAPRVVRVTSNVRPGAPGVVGRDGSFMYKIHDKSTSQAQSAPEDSRSPAPPVRRIRVSNGSRSSRSPPSATAPKQFQDEKADYPQQTSKRSTTPGSGALRDSPEEHNGAMPSTITRPRKGDESGAYSTMRVRRIGGALLNKPVRRGMVRRQSEDDDVNLEDPPRVTTPEMEVGRRAPVPDLDDLPDDLLALQGSPQEIKPAYISPPKSSPRRPISEAPIEQPPRPESLLRSRPAPASEEPASSHKTSSQKRPVFKIPPPAIISAHDQENEPPPTFRKPKASAAILDIHEDGADPDLKAIDPAPMHISPSRQPLAPRSNNTPHRPAPAPPPKMSMLDAATSSAGSRNKKTVHYAINGKMYRRLDCIGRGGSSRVFRIMAENYRIFALKRVNLEEADMAAIAGYKGEIDLLKRLENVDRVIRLYDYEVNEEKGVLSVMMELGETDFNKMLNEQLKDGQCEIGHHLHATLLERNARVRAIRARPRNRPFGPQARQFPARERPIETHRLWHRQRHPRKHRQRAPREPNRHPELHVSRVLGRSPRWCQSPTHKRRKQQHESPQTRQTLGRMVSRLHPLPNDLRPTPFRTHRQTIRTHHVHPQPQSRDPIPHCWDRRQRRSFRIDQNLEEMPHARTSPPPHDSRIVEPH